MTFRDLRAVSGRRGLWLAGEAAAWSAGLPEPSGPAPAGRGRGALLRVELAGVGMLVKRHRRGGLLRGLLPDAFASTRRVVAEALALERLAPLGLAPRCLGVQVSGGLLKSLRIAVAEIPGALDLLEWARRGCPEPERAARAAGRAVRAMHDAGVAHADLNAANVLLRRDESGWRAWVVDLDGARLSGAGVAESRRVREVLRLCRSLDKREATAALGAPARRAFLREALPAGLALRARRRARRQHAWRAAWGHSPRD